MSRRLPEIGEWYQHLDKGQPFCVIATDPVSMVIIVQNFDGDTGEYSFDEWRQLAIEPSAQPENWSGALDVAEVDDLGTEITDTSKADWDAPENELHQPTETGESASQDDYGEGSMREQLTHRKTSALISPHAMPDGVTGSANGIIPEVFSAVWRAEYMEDPDSGLWRAEIFRHDVSECCEIDLESLAEAREFARDFYDQQ